MSSQDSTDEKISRMRRSMQAVYPASVYCGLLTFPNMRRGLAYNARQLVFPVICILLTTALLMEEFPNMFVVRGKKIAVQRHKTSKYNLYVIHVIYFFKLYTTIYTSITRSRWLPDIFHEVRKISEALKLNVEPRDGNRLIWLAVVSTSIPYLVRQITFPTKTWIMEMIQSGIEVSVLVPVILNAQHYQVCVLLGDAFDALNTNLIRNLESPSLSDAEKTILILKFNEAHHRLCDVTMLVNDLYQYPILMEMINNSMGLATCLFHSLDFSVHLSWWLNTSNTLSRFFFMLIRLYFLCFSCTDVLRKSKETINALVKGFELTYDKTVGREIEVFISRVQNERIVFDICGLFHITTKTFISVLRIITSFVLILIQFNPHPSIRMNRN